MCCAGVVQLEKRAQETTEAALSGLVVSRFGVTAYKNVGATGFEPATSWSRKIFDDSRKTP